MVTVITRVNRPGGWRLGGLVTTRIVPGGRGVTRGVLLVLLSWHRLRVLGHQVPHDTHGPRLQNGRPPRLQLGVQRMTEPVQYLVRFGQLVRAIQVIGGDILLVEADGGRHGFEGLEEKV